jgi:hypothetical protein
MVAFVARVKAFAQDLWADTDGIILPYVTIMLVVIVGFSTLALDGARLMNLQSRMQNGADALALAGAYELNGLTDSIQRACNVVGGAYDGSGGCAPGAGAPAALVQNASWLGAPDVHISSILFFSNLPADTIATSSGILDCSNAPCTRDPTLAGYVQVVVEPVSVARILPGALIGSSFSNNIASSATAVAGANQVACKITPMFICNPFENVNETNEQMMQDLNSMAGSSRLVKLRAPTGASQTWGPGDFGFLQPSEGALPNDGCFSGTAGDIGQSFAAQNVRQCFTRRGVDLQTGNTTQAQNGFNTRFGLYGNSFLNASASSGPNSGQSCASLYPPDVNARKGYKAANGASGWCTSNPSGGSPSGTKWPPGGTSQSFPLDSNSSPTTAVGNGTWNCQNYWTANHPAALYPTHTAPPGCTSAATISRFSVYTYEVTNSYLTDHPDTAAAELQETGAPQCKLNNSSPPIPGVANRRTMFVAIVNCQKQNQTNNPIRSNATNIPVFAFAKFFLTIPWPNNCPGNCFDPIKYSQAPYAEFLGVATQQEAGVFNVVQLYR